MPKVMDWRGVLAASAITAFGVAEAQTSAPHQGDWIGTLNNPGAPLTVAIHLGTSAKGETATISVVEFGSRDAPLTNVTVTGNKLHFDDPDAHSVYNATWDEAGHRWNGAWILPNGQSEPLILSSGLPPLLPRVDGLDGDWQGGINAGAGGVLRVALHVHTGADGTTATFDSPDQGAMGLPVLMGLQGRNVSVNMAIVAARFQGELSDDGASIKGAFSRGPIQLPLTFTRASASTAGKSN